MLIRSSFLPRLVLLWLLPFTLVLAQDPKEHVIPIRDLRGGMPLTGKPRWLKDDVLQHKPFDVTVTRGPQIRSGKDSAFYGVSFYRKEKGHLEQFQVFMGDSLVFDHARYAWINDSTFSLKLYNAESGSQSAFVVSGYGGTTRVGRVGKSSH